MKKIKLLITLLISTNSSLALSQTSYLCIPDLSTGFVYRKNLDKWTTTTFDVSKDKYLLSKSSNGMWQWKNFGKENSIECDGEFSKNGYLNCNKFEQVTFNKRNLRFIKVYNVGYVNKGIIGNEGEDTPSMEIGTCSPL